MMFLKIYFGIEESATMCPKRTNHLTFGGANCDVDMFPSLIVLAALGSLLAKCLGHPQGPVGWSLGDRTGCFDSKNIIYLFNVFFTRFSLHTTLPNLHKT